jgi:hypothetical protein
MAAAGCIVISEGDGGRLGRLWLRLLLSLHCVLSAVCLFSITTESCGYTGLNLM